MASHSSSSLSLFLLFNLLASSLVVADLVLEDGYTVTTVLDGHKLGVNPHSVLPRPGSSDLIILDQSNSSFFTVSFSKSLDSVMIKRFAGKGIIGYSDGDLGSSMFHEPKSFAVDLKGNVYVADQKNHVIRKISKTGVTTIAGGYSKKTGKVDGPAQNATFSDDFGLTFVPERCALMISDHGNQLVRQIDLKSEDCAKGSESALGMTSAWVLGLGVSCLLGLVIGFAARPYIMPYEGCRPLHHNETWRHCLISLERRVLMLCFDTRSAIVNSTLYALLKRLILLSLSHLSLMFNTNLVLPPGAQTLGNKYVNLLDSDVLANNETTQSQIVAEQLKDLSSLDGQFDLLNPAEERLESSNSIDDVFLLGGNSKGSCDVFCDRDKKVDRLIEANIMDFVAQAGKDLQGDSSGSSLGLVKRR